MAPSGWRRGSKRRRGGMEREGPVGREEGEGMAAVAAVQGKRGIGAARVRGGCS
jgi:hypothetical protein